MITLLTDYGHEGPYVGVCHGTIRRILPSATIVDVAHSIEPYDVLQGALVLADAIPYLPVGVHVAVVDPGVGTERRGVALGCWDGRHYVGPDNGVLMQAADSSVVEEAIDLGITPPSARTEATPSITFHGRDVFAPAAARLASGVPLAELGEQLDPASLRRVSVPDAEPCPDGLRVAIVACDRFGTLQLACAPEQLGRLAGESRVAISSEHRSAVALRSATFGHVQHGELLLYTDSFGHLAVAVRQGSAAALFGARVGERLTLRAV